jgi:asparagine synthase (glutamine-hydrolysing)
LIDRQLRAEGNANRLNTISACYEESGVDERPFIEAVSAATNTEPHYVFPHAEDVMASADQIIWHQDEPYGSTSIFAQWCVFARAHREKIKVMLDGQGADEQLSGYHGGFGFYFASLFRRAQYGLLARAILERRRYHGVSVAEQLRGAMKALLPPGLISFARRQQRSLARHDWLNSEVFAGQDWAVDGFNAALERDRLAPIRDIGDLCVAMTQATNLPMLLRYEDRNSMAHSVEARVPFLDHRLVEFSIGLGEAHKMVGSETKRILRRAMMGIMPEKVFQRRDKLGFATPEEVWFRGPLRTVIEEGVEDTLRRYPGLLNANGTRKLVREMLDSQRQVDFTLWRIVSIGVWGRVFSVAI